MAEVRQSGAARRGWVVLAAAAVAGGIAGVALSQGGSRGIVPLLVKPAAPAAAPHRRPAPPPGSASASPPAAAHPDPAPAPVAAIAGMPTYPGATVRSLGDDIVAAGMPMAVAVFSTSDPASDVMTFYRNAFEASHKHVLHEWATGSTGYVGWRDAKTNELHGVVIRRDGDQTMVFPSVVSPGRLHLERTKVPDVLPQPDGAERTVVVSMGAGRPGVHESSVVTSVPLTTVESVAEFYRKGFIKKGWHVGQVLVNSGDFGRVTATRDDMRAEAYLRHVDGGDAGPHVEIYVILTTRDHA